MPWAAVGSAEQKEKVDLQRLCRYKPGSHLLSVLPVIRRLVAQVSGGIAQVWARFRLCVEPRARTACVSVRSPVCLLSCKGCQQNCCCSRNRCRVVNWPLLWLEENRWAAKKKGKKKRLFGDQPAAATTKQIVWQRLFHSTTHGLHGVVPSMGTPRSILCRLESSWTSWSSILRDGRKEPGLNNSLWSNIMCVSQALTCF